MSGLGATILQWVGMDGGEEGGEMEGWMDGEVEVGERVEGGWMDDGLEVEVRQGSQRGDGGRGRGGA